MCVEEAVVVVHDAGVCRGSCVLCVVRSLCYMAFTSTRGHGGIDMTGFCPVGRTALQPFALKSSFFVQISTKF